MVEKEKPSRFSLLGIMGGLMIAENLGDVHDELNHLCDLIGVSRFEGNYQEGWTSTDWMSINQEANEE